MDDTQYIFLDAPTVQRLIVERTGQDSYRNDELVTATLLSKFCEKMWATKCAIGFPIKDSETSSIPRVGTSDIASIKEILNRKMKQSHDVDAVVVEHTPDNPRRMGRAFQIKYFNNKQPDMSTDGLIKFIQGLLYAKTDTALVVLLATGGPVQFSRIRASIDFKKFSFSALYFVGLYGNILKLIEVWPGMGKDEVPWPST